MGGLAIPIGSGGGGARFDISNYGVDLTGAAATDANDARISKWWNDVLAVGGAGIIPYGTVNIKSIKLAATGPFAIHGYGKGISRIVSARSDASIIDYNWNGVGQLTSPNLFGLTIISTVAQQTTGMASVSFKGSSAGGHPNLISVRRCDIETNADIGLRFLNCGIADISNNLILSPSVAGIQFDNVANPDIGDTTIFDNRVHMAAHAAADSAAIEVRHASIVRISHNKCWGNDLYGVLVRNTGSPTGVLSESSVSTQIMIHDNQLEFMALGAGTAIAVIADTTADAGNAIAGLHIYGNQLDNVNRAIDIQSIGSGAIVQAMVYNNFVNTGGGLRLVGSITGLSVFGNRFYRGSFGVNKSVECAAVGSLHDYYFHGNHYTGYSANDIADGGITA